MISDKEIKNVILFKALNLNLMKVIPIKLFEFIIGIVFDFRQISLDRFR